MPHNLIEPIVGGPTPEQLIIAVDFDGTICQHPGTSFPAIGARVPHCLPVLKRIQDAGHKLMLWTMRNGEHLADAVQYLTDNGIVCWGCNENPQQSWSGSNKQYAHLYIDDAALGCPLVRPGQGRAFVNWWDVEHQLTEAGVLEQPHTWPYFEIQYRTNPDQDVDTAFHCSVYAANVGDAVAYIKCCLHPHCQQVIIDSVVVDRTNCVESEGGVEP